MLRRDSLDPHARATLLAYGTDTGMIPAESEAQEIPPAGFVARNEINSAHCWPPKDV
jgi:hypothetical protein